MRCHEERVVVDLRDVRMIERGKNAGLAFEARETFRIERERLGKHLDGDVAVELGIAGSIDFAIPPAPIALTI